MTSFGTLIPAFLLAFAGAAVLGFLCWNLFSGITSIPMFSGLKRRFSWTVWLAGLRNRKRLRSLGTIETALQQGQYAQVQRLFQHMLRQSNPGQDFYEEGTDVLRLVLRFSDLRGLHHSNLPRMEELLLQRQSLSKRLLELKSLRKEHQKVSRRGGRAWAEGEFSQKCSDIEQQLDSNEARLMTEFTEVLEALRQKSQPESLTIH